jgi:hypothetical protein
MNTRGQRKMNEITKQMEWLEKYQKKAIINGLKNLVNPDRVKGHRITVVEEIVVTRKEYATDIPYEYVLKQPVSKIKHGTDMSKFKITIDDEKYSWKALSKLPIGLLRYKAFRVGLTEEQMERNIC